MSDVILEQFKEIAKDLYESQKLDKQRTYDKVSLIVDGQLACMELVSLRKAKHMSQKQLAENSGLSSQCISEIENKGNPRLTSLVKYIGALGGYLTFSCNGVEMNIDGSVEEQE